MMLWGHDNYWSMIHISNNITLDKRNDDLDYDMNVQKLYNILKKITAKGNNKNKIQEIW